MLLVPLQELQQKLVSVWHLTVNSLFPDLLSLSKSGIYDEIQSKTNIQREREYFDRVLCRALIADIYTENDRENFN